MREGSAQAVGRHGLGRAKGPTAVYQLEGGIHRYLEALATLALVSLLFACGQLLAVSSFTACNLTYSNSDCQGWMVLPQWSRS